MDLNYIDRIKQLKSEQKITNERLAEMTGIPLGTLSKILAGISDSPKLSNICAICEALGCSVDFVLTGEPENTNNFTLEDGEIRLVERYRQLDRHGREVTTLVLEKELERMTQSAYGNELDYQASRPDSSPDTKARVLKRPRLPVYTDPEIDVDGRRCIMLYDLPVSAGGGVYLDASTAVEITIPVTPRTASADYALRISGNSMEPRFHDGDVLLIEECEGVEVGELGIFVLDGCGYFKRFGGDRLISLNPEYAPIMLKDFANAECVGRVVGKLKKK